MPIRSHQKCACASVNNQELDAEIREFVGMLQEKGICTNSSCGGGPGHPTPSWAYVEAHLTSRNAAVALRHGLLPRVIKNFHGRPLFLGNARLYAARTGFFVLAINRQKLSSREVRRRLRTIAGLFRKQSRHARWVSPIDGYRRTRQHGRELRGASDCDHNNYTYGTGMSTDRNDHTYLGRSSFRTRRNLP